MNDTDDTSAFASIHDEPRYAVYFAPAHDTELSQFGFSWFGEDALTGEPIDRPTVKGIDPELLVLSTRRPRSYGFHATLKAPFKMKEGRDRDSLVASLANFAEAREAFELPALVPKDRGAFVVLGAKKRATAMDSLAADCLRGFDRFRAPMTDAERERRMLADTLSARQKMLLDEWGYPYVLDQFDFHITLAGPCDGRDRDTIVKALTKEYKSLWKQPVVVDAISLFEQAPGEAFRVTERFPFGG